MKPTLEARGLHKISEDLTFILSRFREVLQALGQSEVANSMPWAEGASGPPPSSSKAEQQIQALGIGFQLMNLVEENAAVQFRRQLEKHLGPASIRGSWAETLEQARNQGIKEAQLAEMLSEISVRPVLTAHPTEAKRVTILELHRELYLLLAKLENQVWAPSERKQLIAEARVLLLESSLPVTSMVSVPLSVKMLENRLENCRAEVSSAFLRAAPLVVSLKPKPAASR